MKWSVLYVIEREVEIEADNLNTVCEKAKEKRKEGETIVLVRLKRGQNMGGHGL